MPERRACDINPPAPFTSSPMTLPYIGDADSPAGWLIFCTRRLDELTGRAAGAPALRPCFFLRFLNQDVNCAFIYRATGYEPGGCYRPPAAASAKKSGSHAPACPPCGTYEMSFDCCVACGSSYVWTGTGCRTSGKK